LAAVLGVNSATVFVYYYVIITRSSVYTVPWTLRVAANLFKTKWDRKEILYCDSYAIMHPLAIGLYQPRLEMKYTELR